MGDESSTVRRAFSHAPLRNLLFAWGLSNAALWAWAVTIATLTFQEGGAPAVAIVLAARLIPGAIAAPVVTVLASQMRGLFGPIAVTLVRIAGILIATTVLATEGPVSLLYVAVVIEGLGSGSMHALHIRALPLIARRPDELAIANSMTELLRASGLLLGPLVSSIVLYFGSALAACWLFICLLLASFLLLYRQSEAVGSEPAISQTTLLSQFKAGARAAVGDATILFILLLSILSGLVTGGLQVFLTAIAVDVLKWSSSGPSVLMSFIGLGGLLGGAISFSWAKRKDLSGPLAAGLVLIGLASIVLGAFALPIPAMAACTVGGLGLAVLLVMMNTLSQRAVPLKLQPAVFGLIALLQFFGVGLGGGVASVFVGMWGTVNGAIGYGAGLTGLGIIIWVSVRWLFANVDFYERELEVVRNSKLLHMLTVGPSIQIASCLERCIAEPGERIMKQGDPGHTAYLVGSGSLTVIADGNTIAELQAGDVFGEIALIRDVPRTATVVADVPTELWKLDRETFLYAVTQSPDCQQSVSNVILERLEEIEGSRKVD